MSPVRGRRHSREAGLNKGTVQRHCGGTSKKVQPGCWPHGGESWERSMGRKFAIDRGGPPMSPGECGLSYRKWGVTGQFLSQRRKTESDMNFRIRGRFGGRRDCAKGPGLSQITVIGQARSGAWPEPVAAECGEDKHFGDRDVYPPPTGWVPWRLGLGTWHTPAPKRSNRSRGWREPGCCVAWDRIPSGTGSWFFG